MGMFDDTLFHSTQRECPSLSYRRMSDICPKECYFTMTENLDYVRKHVLQKLELAFSLATKATN